MGLARNTDRCLLAMLLAAAPALAAQEGRARIEGTIRDSVRGVPLARATVIATAGPALHDTIFHSALTDELGRFALAGLRSGRYTLSVEHPRIDSTGIGAPAVDITVPDDGAVTAMLGIPSVNTLRRVLCPMALIDTSVGIMLGSVHRTDGSPVANARVVFSWRDFEFDRGTVSVRSKQLNASATTDGQGVYRACGLPLERPIFVQAQTDAGEQSGVIQEHIGETGVLLRDFRLAQLLAAATPDPAPRLAAVRDSLPVSVAAAPPSEGPVAKRFLLSGRVHRVDGSPITNATINLLGAMRSASVSDEGEFRFGDVPAGTYGLEVISLGFFPRYLRFEVGQEQRPLDVQMERVAVVLDSMRVVARRQTSARTVRYREFDARSKGSVGIYMTENDIANKNVVRTSELFMNVPGVRIVSSPGASGGGSAVLVSTHGRTTFTTASGDCVLDVFLDGRKMNPDEINLVVPAELHGVEVQTVATAPPQYHASQCGAVFLWTK